MKQRMVLYGGAFDPPHHGHMNLLRAVIERVRPHRVLIMPTGVAPHKAASTTPAHQRVQMCRCFLSAAPCVSIDMRELLREGKSYTVDTLRALHEEYPRRELFLALGSDMLLSFREWKDYREIFQLAVLVVQSRAQHDDAQLEEMIRSLRGEGARIIRVFAAPLEISSARLRERLEYGEDVRAYVPAQVYEYLRWHGCYPICEQQLVRVRDYARNALSQARYEHTLNVQQMAVVLAAKNGELESRAALAALLHDIAKELPKNRQREILELERPAADEVLQRAPVVWHGAAAAALAGRQLGIRDEHILSAVACHTTGKAQMSRLDKIIYTADMISKERSYPGVQRLRALALESLDEGTLLGMGMTIEHLAQRGRPMDSQTLLAYRSLKQALCGRDVNEKRQKTTD